MYAIINCPPQHGKTLTVQHGIVWLMARLAGKRCAYVSYNDERAMAVARDTRYIADKVGLPRRPESRKLDHWILEGGGELMWTGIGGGLTGYAVDVLVTDDTLKDRQTAESETQRGHVWGWYTGVAFDRLQHGASVIHVETRWHVDDVSGRLLSLGKEDGLAYQFEHIRLPALDDQGEALAPWIHSADDLRQRKATVGPYEWSAKYQGQPVPRGQELFTAPTYYERLPGPHESTLRYAIGVDLAYTAKTRADYSVAVVLAQDSTGVCYVVDVIRRQVKAPDFAGTLRQLAAKYPGSPMWWYAGGTEKGAADFMHRDGLRTLRVIPATTDKFVRAQPVAAAWQAGNVRIPQQGSWVQAFADELATFTGSGDVNDDQVDALASAYDALQSGGGVGGKTRDVSRSGLGSRWSGPVGWSG